MLKAIIFDADGTLYKVKSKRAYLLTADFLCSKTHIPGEKIYKEWKNTVEKIKSSPADSSDLAKRQRQYALEKTLLALGAKENVKPLARKALKIFWKAVMEDLETFPASEKIIKKLSKNYILMVTSEEFKINLTKKLAAAFGDWRKYFKFLITPEVTGAMKPSEKYYQIAMLKLHLAPEEILAVGDSKKLDIEPAKKIGLKTKKINYSYWTLPEKIIENDFFKLISKTNKYENQSKCF